MTKRIVLALALALAVTARAHAVDLQKLTRDTQRMAQGSGQLTLVWWMPQPWWDAALATNGALSPEGRAQMLAVLDDYMVFAVLRAKVGLGGDLDARPRAEMLANAKLQVGDKVVAPLPPEELSAGAQAVLLGVKPVFASMLGKFGQGLEIIVYPSKQDGRRLADALQPGALQYTLYDQTFTWKTPLPSLLPFKVDAKTGEEFPGDYRFNPYTGEPLVTR